MITQFLKKFNINSVQFLAAEKVSQTNILIAKSHIQE